MLSEETILISTKLTIQSNQLREILHTVPSKNDSVSMDVLRIETCMTVKRSSSSEF